MVITAYTFIFSVITLHTFYRYVIQRNEEFKDLSWLHFQWQFFYLISMLLIIYTANLVTREGKTTSQIAHDIINQCHNSDVSLSVCAWAYKFAVQIQIWLFAYKFEFSLQLTQLSLQIQNHHPIASCGLFEFDWTLLFTVSLLVYTSI